MFYLGNLASGGFYPPIYPPTDRKSALKLAFYSFADERGDVAIAGNLLHAAKQARGQPDRRLQRRVFELERRASHGALGIVWLKFPQDARPVLYGAY